MEVVETLGVLEETGVGGSGEVEEVAEVAARRRGREG